MKERDHLENLGVSECYCNGFYISGLGWCGVD